MIVYLDKLEQTQFNEQGESPLFLGVTDHMRGGKTHTYTRTNTHTHSYTRTQTQIFLTAACLFLIIRFLILGHNGGHAAPHYHVWLKGGEEHFFFGLRSVKMRTEGPACLTWAGVAHTSENCLTDM